MGRTNLDNVISTVYNSLPQSLMDFVSPIAEPVYVLAKRWFLILSQFRRPLYIFEGKEKQSKETLVAGLLGTENSAAYLSELLYSGKVRTNMLGNVSTAWIDPETDSRLADCSLVFIDVDEIFCRYLARRQFIALPSWALFVLDLAQPLDRTWIIKENYGLRRNLIRMRRFKYELEVTHDPSQFEHFYHRMYAPYQATRHKKQWIEIGFQEMKRLFHKGLLFIVKRDGKRLAGNLAVLRGNTVCYHINGVKDGNLQYLKEAALTATYYYSILWAKDNGYRWMDFGHCRPFLNDGLWNYKKKWGMAVRKSDRVKSVLGMRVCKINKAVEEFLSKNPFVFLKDRKLNSLCITTQNENMNCKQFKSLLRNLYMPGIDELFITSPTGLTDEQKRIASYSSISNIHINNMDLVTFFQNFPFG